MPSALDLTRTGIALHLKGDKFGARLHYLAALQDDPKCLPALQNLGQLANDANEFEATVTFIRKILHQCPNDGIQWSNLGNVLMRQEKFDEAVEAMARAVELAPDVPEVWHNFALLRLRQRRYMKALSCIEKAERLGFQNLSAQNDKAHVFLHLGRLTEAWPLYEARWAQLGHLPPWDFHIPEWQGEDLTGKSILVHSDQGLGDFIMLMRFGKRFDHADLTFGVPRCLTSLVEHTDFRALAIEDMNGENMAGFDFQSPIFSSLRWLEVTKGDISSDPYITLSPTHGCPLPFNDKFRVGICWASGRRNTEHDFRGRYSDLKDWLELAGISNVELVSLQQGADENDVAARYAEGLVNDSEIARSRDFLTTAKIIAGLDLVISVDTAVAHLSAAMGKPTWMLSQYTNCWRWWDIDNQSGRPWYRSMRILRQTKPGNWKELIQICVKDLRQRSSSLPENLAA